MNGAILNIALRKWIVAAVTSAACSGDGEILRGSAVDTNKNKSSTPAGTGQVQGRLLPCALGLDGLELGVEHSGESPRSEDKVHLRIMVPEHTG